MLDIAMPADDAQDEQDGAALAADPGTPAATSQQGSGNAASALEAFLDSAAQPSNRQMQHAQSYSRWASADALSMHMHLWTSPLHTL